jgi:hypothetical protein
VSARRKFKQFTDPLPPEVTTHSLLVMEAGMGGRIQQFVLRHGAPMTHSPYDAKRFGKQGKIGMCYMNAFHLVLGNSDMTYCEGYAIQRNLGVPFIFGHAWALTPDGQVVDPTWEDATGPEYFGVRFQFAYLRQMVMRCGHYCSLLENFWDRQRLVRGITPIEEALL